MAITKATGAPATDIVTTAAVTAGSLELTAPLMLPQLRRLLPVLLLEPELLALCSQWWYHTPFCHCCWTASPERSPWACPHPVQPSLLKEPSKPTPGRKMASFPSASQSNLLQWSPLIEPNQKNHAGKGVYEMQFSGSYYLQCRAEHEGQGEADNRQTDDHTFFF